MSSGLVKYAVCSYGILKQYKKRKSNKQTNTPMTPMFVHVLGQHVRNYQSASFSFFFQINKSL